MHVILLLGIQRHWIVLTVSPRQNRNVASFVCIKAYCLKFIMNRRVYLCQERFQLANARFTFREF